MRLQQETSRACSVGSFTSLSHPLITFNFYLVLFTPFSSDTPPPSNLCINFMLPALLFITPHLSLSHLPTRALYDRVEEAEGDLTFKKDDILYVDESLPKGSFGTWMAWQLDENAQQIQRGQIPSKYMWVENEMHAHTHAYLS